jgi:hypothetical protein
MTMRKFLLTKSIPRIALLTLMCLCLQGWNAARAATMWATPLDPTGSWQTTYAVPAFGGDITILVSFGMGGIVIETDTPTAAQFPFDSSPVVVSNGHGAWVPTGIDTFSYKYVKELYPSTGGAGVSVGHIESNATVTVSQDGKTLQIAGLTIKFFDANGNVLFTATGTGTATRIVAN